MRSLPGLFSPGGEFAGFQAEYPRGLARCAPEINACPEKGTNAVHKTYGSAVNGESPTARNAPCPHGQTGEAARCALFLFDTQALSHNPAAPRLRSSAPAPASSEDRAEIPAYGACPVGPRYKTRLPRQPLSRGSLTARRRVATWLTSAGKRISEQQHGARCLCNAPTSRRARRNAPLKRSAFSTAIRMQPRHILKNRSGGTAGIMPAAASFS